MKTSADIKSIIKDSLFTGLISLALFGPIVGLKTSSKGQGLFVTPHVSIVVLLVVACVVGRFLIGLNSMILLLLLFPLEEEEDGEDELLVGIFKFPIVIFAIWLLLLLLFML